ncbi:family 43 glycosylhydrolase [Halobacillus sp. H74]|uniref:family 43 glycosylhydrolase n=1 Tax=Halobacillus sp. H74 TaxID=3457436 RepID=UPI003FCC4553
MKVKTIPNIDVHTSRGVPPDLPSRVNITIDEEVEADVEVKWNAVKEQDFQIPGSFKVEGTIQDKDYPNPLIEQRADPYIYLHEDGFYYFTASHPLYDRIVLRRASSIEGLPDAEEVVVWEKHESGIMSEHIWAPEIHFIDGKWYIYFAGGEKGDVWAIRPYVLENDQANPLEGEWVEKGQINTDFQSFSLDATTFEHNGKRFLVWAQKVQEDTISNLYISEMANPWTIKGPQVLLATPEYEWEVQGFDVNEGPAMISRNGRVFISYSGSATDDRYAMGLLEIGEHSDLLDPDSWIKHPEPVFVSSEETEEYGPGHNSFTTDKDGTDLLVYHARPYKRITGNPLYDYNRHARTQRMFWKKDGTPYFGYPGLRLEKRKVRATVHVK